MPSNSARLGLIKWTTADDFRNADLVANWNKLDAFPGIFICTSITRPSNWALAQEGNTIYEIDTSLYWTWTGSSWARRVPAGFLGQAERLSDLVTTSTNYQLVVTTNITIPQGDRRVMIVIENSGVTNTLGLTEFAIFRGATQIANWFTK